MAFGADFSKTIRITVDLVTKQATSGMRQFSSAVKGADGPLGKARAGSAALGTAISGIGFAGLVGGATVAAGALAAFGAKSVDAASDLEESMNRVATVFGSATPQITKFIENANEIGLSDRQAAQYAGTLGNMLNQLGVASAESAVLSERTIRLAADFASFNNLPTEEVLQGITAALRGEYDQLQRVVPTINAAAVEQKAMEMTGKETTKALTEQEKALAALAIITEDAGAAAGDFERTSDSLANQQKILASEIDDLSVSLGNALLPVVTEVTQRLNDMIDVGRDVAEFLGDANEKAKEATGGVNLFDQAWGNAGVAFNQAEKVGRKVLDLFGLGRDASEDAADAMSDATREADLFAQAEFGVGGAAKAAADGEAIAAAEAEALATEQERAEAAADALATALEEQADSYARVRDEAQETVDLYQSFADSQRAAEEANEGFAESVRELIEKGAEHNETVKEFGPNSAEAQASARELADALDGVTESAISSGEAARANAENQARLRGDADATTQGIDAQNRQLLAQAGTLSGPHRAALLTYIGNLNGIEAEKVTEISTLIDQGRYDEAFALVTELSAPRTASVTAEAHTEGAEAELARLEREREAIIRTRVVTTGETFKQAHSLHKVDVETGRELGMVVPDSHTLEVEVQTAGLDEVVDVEEAVNTLKAAREAAADSDSQAAKQMKALGAVLGDLDTLYRIGAVNQATYMNRLRQHLAGFSRFSLEWIEITERLQREEEKAAAEEKRIFDERTREREAFTDKLKDSFTDVADAVAEFRGEAVTTKGFTEFLQKETQGAANFANLLFKLSRTNLNPELIRAIAEAGPQAFGVAQALASASPQQIANINLLLFRLARTTGRSAAATALDFFGLGGVVRAKAATGMVVRTGETGPEDVFLPEGSHVVPTQRTRMWTQQAAQEGRLTPGRVQVNNSTVNISVRESLTAAQVAALERQYRRRNGEVRVV